MPRQLWGGTDGVPEGSDFTLEALLTVSGATDTSVTTSSGTYTLTISDSALNAGVDLLTDEASDTFNTTTFITGWNITDTQSSSWEAGVYNGDIKLVDSGGLIRYWPVSMKVRSSKD